MTFDYEAWLKQAQDRLEFLYQQRSEIDKEIADLQHGIEEFTPLVKKYPPWARVMSQGITAAITQVFEDNPNKCYGPTDIRDELLKRKISLDQKNPLATIHQIISRLEERGFIKPMNNNGRRLYYHESSERIVGTAKAVRTATPPLPKQTPPAKGEKK
jgi:DNA-binding transcriptional MerR regulator